MSPFSIADETNFFEINASFGVPVTYDGKAHYPTVTGKNERTNTTEFVLGKNYTVTFTKDGEEAEGIDVGVYEAVVKGMGNYTGQIDAKFNLQ